MKRLLTFFLIIIGFTSAWNQSAAAGQVELSFGVNFSRRNYSEDSFTWNRRWGASIGYHLTETSEIELGFQDIVDRTKIIGYEDTTFHDQIYSANWVQALTGKKFAIQPYVKAGIGQLNREASGNYANGGSPPARVDSVTGILGAGMRIFLLRNFAIRAEGTTYLEGGSLRSWRDNIALTIGTSFYF